MRINSIRARFQLLLGIIFIIIMTVTGYRAWERRTADIATTVAQLEARTRLAAAPQREAIRQTAGLLAVLRATRNLQHLAASPACASTLSDLVRLDDRLAAVMLIAPDGTISCANSGHPALNVAERSYWRPALADDKVVVGGPLWGRISQRWVLPVALRYYDAQGRIAGVILAALDMSWVHRSLHKADFPPETRLELLTSSGQVVASLDGSPAVSHPAASEAWQALKAQAGRGHAVLGQGTARHIYVFEPFAQTIDGPVYLWASLPLSLATAKARNQWVVAISTAIIVISIAFALTWVGGRYWLVAPLNHIGSVARRLAAGDFEARTHMDYNSGEVGVLARAVDDMARQLGRYDNVTGLYNARAFEEALTQDIQRAGEHGLTITVVQVAIVDFHHLESSYGKEISRAVLREVGTRLQALTASRGVVARISDSGYALAVLGLPHSEAIVELVDEMRVALCQNKLVVIGHEVLLSVRFGVSIYPDDGQSPAVLLQRAGVALDHVDTRSRSSLQFYRQEMNEQLQRRLTMAARMREAIDAEEFVVQYQPQMGLGSGRVTGLEALVRWHHPGTGTIPPLEFIPLAEETGLIVPLGRWILREALRQFRQWQVEHAGLGDLVLAVNVSAVQLAHPDFVGDVADALRDSGVPACRLELELTESQLMSSARETVATLEQLKQLGVLLAIDDFGTGYSSLAYLKHFHVDKLKIDKSFIDHLTTDNSDTTIVQATIAMGHKLGLAVIAEGVETSEQLAYLRSLDCDQVQGYFFSRPLAAADIPAFLQRAPQAAV